MTGSLASSWVLSLSLLVCLTLLTLPPVANASTTTAPPTNVTVNISLGLIWDSAEAVSNITDMFNLMLPMIQSACPTARRVETTKFNTFGFGLDTLPTNDQLRSVVDAFSASNFLFLGIKQNSITQILDTLVVPTSLLEYPVMQRHVVSPMPQTLLLDVIMTVVSQRIDESQNPQAAVNFKAALFIDSSVSITEMYQMFTYFSEGLMYFQYDQASLEENLLKAKNAQIINIIVIVLDANHGRVLRDVAFSLGMFASRFRWFIHGPRLINDVWDGKQDIVSMNVTSIEFGRLNDALAQGVWSTTGAMIFDLLSIWTPYLKNYLCEQRQSINRSVSGLTGKFQLNPDGSSTRVTWQLEVYIGLGGNRQQVGEWNSNGKFEMLPRKDAPRATADVLTELRANTFKVATVLAPPYVQLKAGVTSCSPCRDGITGMYIEICKRVLQNLGISNYEFWVQTDSAFGVFNGSSWNGVMQSVVDGKVKLGCAPTTVNTDRYKVVDFSQVIHSSRESLLFRKREIDIITQVFQFILPLKFTIWIAIFGALFLLALVLFAMHKIAPNKDANYNLYNSIFFSFAEVVQGTPGTTPTQISGRIVVTFCWFFTLFLFLSYIANYAVFRTLEGVRQEVTSIDTLIENRDYDCGSLANTVTDSLLKSSAYLQMQQMYLLMTETFQNGSVPDMNSALALMNKRNFVLINDNLQNQYYRDKGCDMISTGDFYDLKNGLILPKGNDFGYLIDAQLANLTATITALQTAFFTVPKAEKQSCYDGTFTSAIRYYTPKDAWPIKTGALTLEDTLGITVINLLGCCIAIVLAGVERGIGRMQQGRSDARRKQQVDEANAVKFKRPTD